MLYLINSLDENSYAILHIDFIFSKKDIFRVVGILKSNGYFSDYEVNYLFPGTKHYPRLKNHNKISAVEIHQNLIFFGKYYKDFDYNFIKRDLQTINKFNILSFKNQLSLSIIASQINDLGFKHKSLTLRNAYDVFLLSKKTTAKNAFKKFNRLENPLNCFLASCFEVFNKPVSLQYTCSKKIKKYLDLFYKYINDRKLAEQKNKKTYKKETRKKLISYRFRIILYSFFYRKYTSHLVKKILNRFWRKEKLI